MDNIEYYKIMYLLGEGCQVGTKRSKHSSSVGMDSSSIFELNKEIDHLD